LCIRHIAQSGSLRRLSRVGSRYTGLLVLS
jgi:hypothetical protein